MIGSLLNSTIIMLLLMIPGFILRKTGIDNGNLAKGLSSLIIYGMQPGMIMHAFVETEFKPQIFTNCAVVLLLCIIMMGVYYLISKFLFKKADKEIRKVLRFAIIFSNAGYMGIPIINYVLGAEATIYASVYIVGFNLYSYSLGFLIYSEDKKYISVKNILLNPATVSIVVSLLLFVTGANRYVPAAVTETLAMMKNSIAPLAMTIIGIRLADLKLDGLIRDKYLYYCLSVRHFIFPFITWGILYLIRLAGVPIGEHAFATMLICASTPAATATSMYAEKFDGEKVYASKIVSISTVLSVVTMPIMALLLEIK